MTMKQWNKICFLFCSFPNVVLSDHVELWQERAQQFLFSFGLEEIRLSKYWGQSKFPPGPGLSSKQGKGDLDMGFSSQRPNQCSEELLENRRRSRGQGAAPMWGRGLPEGCLALEDGAHWVVTAFLEPHETQDRSAATLICSPLFLSYLQQRLRLKPGNTCRNFSDLTYENTWFTKYNKNSMSINSSQDPNISVVATVKSTRGEIQHRSNRSWPDVETFYIVSWNL